MSIFQHHVIYFSLVAPFEYNLIFLLPFISVTQLSGYMFEQQTHENKGLKLPPTYTQ